MDHSRIVLPDYRNADFIGGEGMVSKLILWGIIWIGVLVVALVANEVF